jgi:hypothetical protein
MTSLDYALGQSRHIVELVTVEGELHDALECAVGWARITYQALIEAGVAPLFAAVSVAGIVQQALVGEAFMGPEAVE